MTLPFGFDRPDLWWLVLLWLPMVALAWTSKRRLSRRRWWTTLAVRTVLLLSMVAALCELTWRHPVDDLAVVFVLDRSASVGPEGRARGEAFVREALQHQEPGDRAAVVVFGDEAVVERDLQEALDFPAVEAQPSPHHSDLGAGLRLGTALLPADRTRRLVLVSDGEQTRGDAVAQALMAGSEDLELSVVQVGRADGPEALLEDLVAPARVDEGAAYEVKVVARSRFDADAKIRMYRNDEYLGAMPVELAGGKAEVFTFRQQAEKPGLYRYRAVLEIDEALDGQPENNRVVGTVQVSGSPRVLVVEREKGHGQHLAEAMRRGGLQVDLVGVDRLPSTLVELRNHAAVVLVDVPAYMTTTTQQEALRSYVRDLGRGLAMVGGDHSFGVGGWYKTPVEEALPVRMDLEDKTRFPALAMVLAIDKSCSMGAGSMGNTSMDLAKEAAIQTAELLNARDSLGVISFDAASTWISPLAPLDDKQRVFDDVAALKPGGGTVLYPAIQEATRALRASDAALKHMVVLSDGIVSGQDPLPLIRTANGEGVTLTSVAVGSTSNNPAMESFARAGGGNSYAVVDKSAIPAIFTREAMLASRSFLVEGPFLPKRGSASPITRGLGGLPTLEGYIATEPRPRSTVPLWVPDETHGDLPLLAHGRYGLGRSLAWTSDARGRWATKMLGTADFTRLWTQTGRFLATEGAQGIDVSAEIRDGELLVGVDAFAADGSFRNFLDGEARVVAPDLQVHPLRLQQVAPGRYEARLPIDQDGSWMVGVELSEEGETVAAGSAEAVQPYSPEYRIAKAGGPLLQELARVGGGELLDRPELAFRRPEVARMVPTALWPWLLGLAAFLLLLDVATRRLEFGRVPGMAAASVPVAKRPRFRPARGEVVATEAPKVDAAGPVEEASDLRSSAPDVPEDSYAGRLLAARKKARDRQDRR